MTDMTREESILAYCEAVMESGRIARQAIFGGEPEPEPVEDTGPYVPKFTVDDLRSLHTAGVVFITLMCVAAVLTTIQLIQSIH